MECPRDGQARRIFTQGSMNANSVKAHCTASDEKRDMSMERRPRW
jgi:hypothetical protein